MMKIQTARLAAFALLAVSSVSALCDLSGNWTDATATNPIMTPSIIISQSDSGDLTLRNTMWLATSFSGRIDGDGTIAVELPREFGLTTDTPTSSPYSNPTNASCSYLPALKWCKYPHCPRPEPEPVVWPTTPLHCAANPPCKPPTWKPTYQLNASTVLQPCNASGPLVGDDFVGLWSLDWNNQRTIWSQHPLNATNCSQMLVDSSRVIKEHNPNAKVFVYRNLELALEWLETERAAMYDPSKEAYFLHTKDGAIYNEARSYGSQYFWNFSNPDAVEYFINEAALGKYGLESPYVDGIYTDDVVGTFQEHPYAPGNLSLTRQEFVDIQAANAALYTKLLDALRAHNGFNWQATSGWGDVVAPRITQETCNATMSNICASRKWMDGAMIIGFGEQSDWLQQIGGFLLGRGDHWWIGYGWQGCNGVPLPVFPPEIHMDVGVPTGECSYIGADSLGKDVWARSYSNGVVKLACDTWKVDLPFKY